MSLLVGVIAVSCVTVVIAHLLLRVQAFKQLAYTDSLTNLPNRAALIKHLHRALRESGSRSKLTAVIFFDLDNFKSINDRLGHAFGDRVLTLTAARLAAGIRTGDAVARFGGDEFVVVANNLNHASDADLVYKRQPLSKNHPAKSTAIPYVLLPVLELLWWKAA